MQLKSIHVQIVGQFWMKYFVPNCDDNNNNNKAFHTCAAGNSSQGSWVL